MSLPQGDECSLLKLLAESLQVLQSFCRWAPHSFHKCTRQHIISRDTRGHGKRLASGWSSQTMLMTLPRGAKAARLARRPLMSSFHHATTTRLASLAAVSSSEDSARSIACTAQNGWLHRHNTKCHLLN